MKKSRLSVIWILISLMLAACAGGRDITTEKTTEQPKEPAIVLGDENLPEPEIPEKNDEKDALTQPEEQKEESVDKASGESSAPEKEVDATNPVTGPVLVIGAAPKSAVLEGNTADADGGYTETLLCEDGRVVLITERGRAFFSEPSVEEIQQYFTEKGNWRQVTLARADDVLSESVGFPVFRFRYVTGEGEESVMHNMIYIAHEEYSFVLDASAEASDYPDIEELTETWIGSVSIFDGEQDGE